MTLTPPPIPVDLGHISASYVNLLFDWLELAHPDLARQIPFDRPSPGDLNRVPVADWQPMLAWVDQQLKDPDMPLRVAASVKTANTGLLGYMASCCATLGEAFARLQQFEHLIYSVNALQVQFDGGLLCLRWGAERGKPGHWVDSVAIGVLVSFTGSLVDQPVPLTHVCFVNPPPVNVAYFERFFGCPVLFDQPYTEVAMPDSVLQWSLKSPDAALRQLLDQQAEQLLARVPEQLEAMPGLQRAIQDSVLAGLPMLEEVAKRLCMSARTLQRHLQSQGMTFRGELEKVRIRMARHCLEKQDMSLVDLASFLGYNDQSAFTHAFKRAVGQSPAKYQKSRH
ncbi:AraC family transcriptional regulator ligand-binding domain-containing protein [Limnobacter humi]|uniref:AraC family transcriptional regulator ligand-binding domain-containing protein n=1 Tax=Limnobacter humi TaxID=1778671 RepID=A0ABT1WK09_9BURK|nr:AraC family transcriptional regulator ligand-binding domain-containing protein [Limnobacter humi]MCQ8897263.1 AraC family transcriptional regulator ligand-binding domain-containing protein [Limnobacter humi]